MCSTFAGLKRLLESELSAIIRSQAVPDKRDREWVLGIETIGSTFVEDSVGQRRDGVRRSLTYGMVSTNFGLLWWGGGGRLNAGFMK